MPQPSLTKTAVHAVGMMFIGVLIVIWGVWVDRQSTAKKQIAAVSTRIEQPNFQPMPYGTQTADVTIDRSRGARHP